MGRRPPQAMFDTLLIANRGEIACRIMRTARRMGLRTIAVYSDADRDARHVALADRAVRIGAADPSESYLRAETIIEAALRHGAGAVHPGYGFLAENANFAEACAAAGLRFVGPPGAAIRAMGEKDNAKRLMEKAGVPVVPGYHGRDQRLGRLRRAATEIGYPLLIKPVAGGGGKGMRRVAKPAELNSALRAARREAKSAFGDDRLLIERFITRSRHIEIQVIADSQGHTIHLFERDCSIQRRHQKIIEEAPAPGISSDLRARMGEAAVASARAIDYVGTGTIEFIAEAAAPNHFYFMEMNTRLQVEHPVTEMITGLDLVEWQLRIAAGQVLPLTQDEVALAGHAIEARIYAEDPDRDFLPTSGRLTRARWPRTSAKVRIDAGVEENDAIPVHYDPLIAKLIVHGSDRADAVARLARALGETVLGGLRTNLGFLGAIARHDAFAAGGCATDFVDRHRDALNTSPLSDEVFAVACLAMLMWRRDAAAAAATVSGDPNSPWSGVDGWRLDGAAGEPFTFRRGLEERLVMATALAHGYRLRLGDREMLGRGAMREGRFDVSLDDERMVADVVAGTAGVTVVLDGAAYDVEVVDPLASAALHEVATGNVRAPMPGRVTAILVKPGVRVSMGAPLAIVEAMKMEHTVRAPTDGRVGRILHQPGQQVEEGVELLVFTPDTA